MSREPVQLSTGAGWFAELSGGNLTPAQKAALADWLRESPTHVRELLEHTLIHEDLAVLQLEQEQIDAWVHEARALTNAPIAMRQSILSRTEDAEDFVERVAEEGVSRATSRAKGLAIAASLLVALCVTATIAWWPHGRYATGFGEQRIVTLVDGSVVRLNTDSVVKVRFTDHRRAIELRQGEAYFRVAHDVSRPFQVIARDATVEALGTEFNVRIVPLGTIVSVVDGKVEVRADQVRGSTEERSTAESKVQLTKGEEARVPRIKLGASETPSIANQAASATASRASAWTRGRVEFDATPLAEVLSEFQRYRNFNVQMEDESIGQVKLTGSFDAFDLDSALEYIATLPGIEVEDLGRQSYVIRRR